MASISEGSGCSMPSGNPRTTSMTTSSSLRTACSSQKEYEGSRFRVSQTLRKGHQAEASNSIHRYLHVSDTRKRILEWRLNNTWTSPPALRLEVFLKLATTRVILASWKPINNPPKKKNPKCPWTLFVEQGLQCTKSLNPKRPEALNPGLNLPMTLKVPPSSSRPKCGKAVGLPCLLASAGVHDIGVYVYVCIYIYTYVYSVAWCVMWYTIWSKTSCRNVEYDLM